MYTKIKLLASEKNMTIAELCKKTGISRKSIENTKNHDIGFSKMKKIAEALEVSLDDFK